MIGMRIAGAKCKISLQSKCKIHQQEKETRYWIRGSTENTRKSAPKRVRDSRESILRRSFASTLLRGTSMQDETRMHVSVQRSTSSKKKTRQKWSGESKCERKGEYKMQTKLTNNWLLERSKRERENMLLHLTLAILRNDIIFEYKGIKIWNVAFCNR